MSNILASYPSKSTVGKSYFITKPVNGGDPYCTCWQWKRNRTCSHLQDYFAGNLTIPAPPIPTFPHDEISLAIKEVLG